MRDDILRARREKLAKLKDAGIDPFPEKARRTVGVAEAFSQFGKLSRKKAKLALAGRLMGLRYHGGLVFGDLKDASGTIQILFRRDVLEKKFGLLQYFDIGDFLSLEGTLFTTKAGEKTLEVRDFSILAKSLRPLPSTWYGLEDVEERFRKRYLDLLVNKEVFDRFLARARTIASIRQFLEKEGFIEVETPILQVLYGGAAAKPFKTQLEILHLPLYLRIAPELYLKRLLVAGFEKIYELGKSFRNEGMDREHFPEFTMLELYWAYEDREGLMEFCEELLLELAKKMAAKRASGLTYQGKAIPLKRPWPRVSFSTLLKEAVGFDYMRATEEDLRRAAAEKGIDVQEARGKGKVADQIFKKLAIPKLSRPTFVIDHPVEISPLAKRKDNVARRFQLVVAGWEIMNGFSELNDPIDQRERFEAQEKMRRAGDVEAHPIDEDYLEALEYGMPPAAGLGIGIDRLIAILTDAPSLKEVIFFPLMKPK